MDVMGGAILHEATPYYVNCACACIEDDVDHESLSAAVRCTPPHWTGAPSHPGV